MSNILLSIFLALRRNSWLTCWLIIEINLMMFIPYLCNVNKIGISIPIKYFLIQCMGSIILLVGIIVSIINIFSYSLIRMSPIIILAIIVKSGIPPFHFWFPQILERCNEIQIILLLTLQKVIPLTFIRYNLNEILILMAFLSSIVGAIGGFRQNSVKKIIAYSSIVHGGWVILSIILNLLISIIYFFCYRILSVIMLFMFKYLFLINIRHSSFSMELHTKILIVFNLISLGGMPPLLGFLNKLIVIIVRVKINLIILIISMVIVSLVSLTYYIRISYISLSSSFFFFKEKERTRKANITKLVQIRIFFNLMFISLFFFL